MSLWWMSLKGYILSLIIFYGLMKNFSRYSAHLVMILNMDDWLGIICPIFQLTLIEWLYVGRYLCSTQKFYIHIFFANLVFLVFFYIFKAFYFHIIICLYPILIAWPINQCLVEGTKLLIEREIIWVIIALAGHSDSSINNFHNIIFVRV